MSKRKPPDSAETLRGFPYEVLWEDLTPDWEHVRLNEEQFNSVQARFAAVRILGAPPHMCVTAEQIYGLLAPLGLEQKQRELLTLHWYWIAGIHLSRDHAKFLNRGTHAMRSRLEKVGRAARVLKSELLFMTGDTMALLQLSRSLAARTSKPQEMFNWNDLIDSTGDLALTADHLIEDIPHQGKGRVVDNWRDRWIWFATLAIEEWAEIPVRALQSDTTGRRPILEGAGGPVLLSYLRLVSPGMRIGTVVRVIAERRRALRAGPAS